MPKHEQPLGERLKQFRRQKDQRSTNIYYHQHQGNIDKALEKLNTL